MIDHLISCFFFLTARNRDSGHGHLSHDKILTPKSYLDSQIGLDKHAPGLLEEAEAPRENKHNKKQTPPRKALLEIFFKVK